MLQEVKISKFPKNFNFRKIFSSKEDGTCHTPWRNKNPNSNISNYRFRACSIKPYKMNNGKIISYIIKAIGTWIVVGKSFVNEDQFQRGFYNVGIVPNQLYWTRTISGVLNGKMNQCFKGFKLFKIMVDSEAYEVYENKIYKNKLTTLFLSALEKTKAKVKRWEQIKEQVLENKLAHQEQNEAYFQIIEQYSNLNKDNKSPPSEQINWNELKEKLKDI